MLDNGYAYSEVIGMIDKYKLPKDQKLFSVDELKKQDFLITKSISW